MPTDVMIAGGTGYLGQRLIRVLLARGHRVRALVRHGSVARVPPGVDVVEGNALDARSYATAVRPGDTVMHLVGTPHPSPSKAVEFRRVDLPSIQAAVSAASTRGATHIVYVSVAQPAPIMKVYQEVRLAGECAIRDAGLTATILRPWYVLGPGHRWPLAILPLYAIAGLIPSLRPGASRLGLVRLPQMVAALCKAVEDPPAAGAVRLIDVPAIRSATLNELQ